jgi:hypothetical protein
MKVILMVWLDLWLFRLGLNRRFRSFWLVLTRFRK